MKLIQSLVDWADVRLGVRKLWAENTSGYLVPRNINKWYSLGTVLLVLFSLQFATGILLLIHYVPDVEKAFASVERIVNVVPYGWLIRSLHAVCSNLIIVVLLLHMLSVLLWGRINVRVS